MFNEDDLVMISGLQHLLFCPRQCALIHVEQQWTENRLTAEGRIIHERVHKAAKQSRKTCRIEFDVLLRSLQLGLIGRGDIVEFHLQADKSWQPYPVEYKRGRPKKDESDKVQLCAQAMCLEEMLQTSVPNGSLYYGQKKRRLKVVFDDALRDLTRNTTEKMHHLIESGTTPPPTYDRRCESCSFIETCLPKNMGKKGTVKKYFQQIAVI